MTQSAEAVRTILARVQALFRTYLVVCLTIIVLSFEADPGAEFDRIGVDYDQLKTVAQSDELSAKIETELKARAETELEQQWDPKLWKRLLANVEALEPAQRTALQHGLRVKCDSTGASGRCQICTWMRLPPGSGASVDAWLSYAADPTTIVGAHYSVQGLASSFDSKPIEGHFAQSPILEVDDLHLELDMSTCRVKDGPGRNSVATIDLGLVGGEDPDPFVVWSIDFAVSREHSMSGPEVFFPGRSTPTTILFPDLRGASADLRKLAADATFHVQLRKHEEAAEKVSKLMGFEMKVTHIKRFQLLVLYCLSLYFSAYLLRLRKFTTPRFKSIYEDTSWFPLFGRGELWLFVVFLLVLPAMATQHEIIAALVDPGPITDGPWWHKGEAHSYLWGLGAGMIVAAGALASLRGILALEPEDPPPADPLRFEVRLFGKKADGGYRAVLEVLESGSDAVVVEVGDTAPAHSGRTLETEEHDDNGSGDSESTRNVVEE